MKAVFCRLLISPRPTKETIQKIKEDCLQNLGEIHTKRTMKKISKNFSEYKLQFCFLEVFFKKESKKYVYAVKNGILEGKHK